MWNPLHKTRTLPETLMTLIVSSLVLMLLVCSTIWFVAEYSKHQAKVARTERSMRAMRKAMISMRVEDLIERLEFQVEAADKRMLQVLESQTRDALVIAANIAEFKSPGASDQDVQAQVLAVLSAIRNDETGGHLLVLDRGGECLFSKFGRRPDEAAPSVDPDDYPEAMKLALLDVALRGGGHFRYDAKNQVEGPLHFNIRYLDTLDMAIGYVVSEAAFLAAYQKTVIESIEAIEFDGPDEYFFITSLDGRAIASRSEGISFGDDVSELKDSNGLNITFEAIVVSKDPQGGYFEYQWPRPGESTPKPKISFVKRLPRWNWVVGCGSYLDDVEVRIQAMQDDHHRTLIRSTVILIGVSVLGLLLTVLVARLFVIRIRQEIEVFTRFFSGAARQFVSINPGQLTFREFKVLAGSANEMIAAREGALDSLRQSEERFQLAVSGSRDGLFDWDCTTDKIYFSPRWKRMLGYRDDEIPNSYEQWMRHIHPDDINAARDRFLTALHGDGDHFENIFRVIDRVKTLRWFKNRGVILRGADGKPLRVVGFRTDITEQKKMETEIDHVNALLISERNLLADEKERLAVTLKSIADAVITTDTEGRILILNAAAETLVTQAQADVVNRSFYEIFKIIDATGAKVADTVDRVVDGSAVFSQDDCRLLIGHNETPRNISLSCAPIFNAESIIVGAVLVIRDVTEKLNMEEELVRAQKLESLGILAGGIAHDFNNLLMAILGNISLAKADAADGLDVGDLLSEAESVTFRARDITKQLLTFAKGGQPVRNLHQIGDHIQETAEFSLHGSLSMLEVTVDPDLWSAEVDIGQIGQVINNLTINADQAMPDGGLIRIEVRNAEIESGNRFDLEPGRYLKVRISDQGTGIPESIRDRIFDPYFTTKQSGSGLGLASVFSIVRKHKGGIEVESTSGVGTAFTLYLPASSEGRPLVADPIRKADLDSILPRRVLLMDDDQMILETCGRMFEKLGCQTSLARDGEEAIEAYEQAHTLDAPFDLVMVDLTVPGGLGGVETLEILSERYPDVKVVASSGYSTDPVMSRHKDLGFAAAIGKPYTIEDLKDVLATIC